jgi:hypothetical protein
MNSGLDAVHDCLLSLERLEARVARAAAEADELSSAPPPGGAAKRAGHAAESHTPNTIADSMYVIILFFLRIL